MPTALTPLTPTDSDSRHAEESSRTLARLLREEGRGADIHLRHDGAEAEEITLPASVARLLQDVLEQIGKGRSVVVMPVESELTTTQAAELLGVSRPFLIDLLEQGEMPFHQVGTHRRVRLTDVLAYREERERRFAVLQELAAESEALGL